MKWRNQLLALVCLALFGALGVLYFQTWVVQKPFAIILFLGEGLTSERLAATRIYSGGADATLAIDALEYSARARNYSLDFAVPDAAAAASAIATGVKVKNGAVATEPSGAALVTILELAHAAGRSTGIISDGSLTNNSIAPFYAHAASVRQSSGIAAALLDSSAIDVALGGGGSEFVKGTGGMRVLRRVTDFETISAWQRPRVLGLFADGDLPFSDEVAARTNKPALAEMVRHAITLLQLNRRGYLLVVNAHLMGKAASQNLGERTLRETLELDHAVQAAREYAGSKAAIIVAGDVAIGGMNVNGFPNRYDSGVAILGLNSSGQPWITWATGPNARPANTQDKNQLVTEPAALGASDALNAVADPIVSGTGLGTERIRGVIDQTEIFQTVKAAL
ncbi:MAG: alkaline phosphatase [Verrucomicrobiota bacterium]